MSVPTDYKTLTKMYPCNYTGLELPFFHSVDTFAGTPFEPFVRKGHPMKEMDCPACYAEACRVIEAGTREDAYVLYCENCGWLDLTAKEVETTIFDIEALIEAICETMNGICEKRDGYWSFGRMAIGGKSRQVYFSPFPSEAIVNNLLQDTNSILITFDAKTEHKEKYSHQLYTVGELQKDSNNIELDLSIIGGTIIEKPKPVKQNKKKIFNAKTFEKVLEQQIRLLRDILLSNDKQLLKVYKVPSLRMLADLMTLEGVESCSHSTLRRMLNSPDPIYKICKLLYYQILQNPEQAKLYMGLAHLRSVNHVNH